MSDPDTFASGRRARTVVALLAALTIVGSGAAANAAWHAWRDPHVFGTDDAAVAGMRVRLVVGETVSIGMSYVVNSTGAVTVDSARPRILVNTAKATVTVSVCTIDPSRGVGAIGSAHDLS